MSAPTSTAATWTTVLVFAATGGWLLWAPGHQQDPPAAIAPAQPAVTARPTLEPLAGPASRRAPTTGPSGTRERAATTQDARVDTVTSTATAPDQPPQLAEPWSRPGDQPADTDLLNPDWLPSDHSGAESPDTAAVTGSAAPTQDSPQDEARRQLGQAFPEHLPPAAAGADDAIQAARAALEQDLQSTPLRRNVEQVAALILTPDPAPEPGVTLIELPSLDVIVQVQIQTRLQTTETRIYRVTLARTSDEEWDPRSIRLL